MNEFTVRQESKVIPENFAFGLCFCTQLRNIIISVFDPVQRGHIVQATHYIA